MKLTGYKTSPYFRLIHTLCIELGFECELDIITFVMKATPNELDILKSKNPLIKIPVLIDGDITIFDSRIIANYLLNKAQETRDISFPLTIDEENRLSAIYGMLESGLLRFIMSQDNADMRSWYMKRSYDRIGDSLSYLNDQDFSPARFGIPEILLVCTLEWFEKRQIYDWRTFPKLENIYTAYKDRASLIETRIPENA